jgi:hypothetical protein
VVRRLASLLVVALAVGTGCGGGGDGGGSHGASATRADQVRDAAHDAGLPAEVADLLADAAGVPGASFEVTYDLGGVSGGTAVLTQDPPRRRVDLHTRVGGDDVTRALITDRDQTTVCERAAGKWTCRAGSSSDAASPSAFGADQVEQVVGDLKTAKDAYTFRVAARDVAGVKARCLVTELKPGRQPTADLGAKGTLCVSAEGVPLLVETPAASLRALKYTTHVPDDAFDAPAKVTGS